MLIEAMPEVLTWRMRQEVLDDVRSAYLSTLADAFARLLQPDPGDGAALFDAFRALPEAALSRVLEAPETSTRLLFPTGEREATLAFLLCALRAEAVREGIDGTPDLPGPVWTALGDALVHPDGGVEAFAAIDGLPPLDFGSPYALALDLSGAERVPPPPRGGLEPAARAVVERRLREVANGIAAAGHGLGEFVSTFNCILIAQPDPESPGVFSSGSNGRYIGRSFVANAHADGVDAAVLADAIVHEGIHALLYMQEYHRAWVHDPSLESGTPRVSSPWSGNRLALRPFLQACFVWYGLLNFWALALEAGAFERADVQRMLGRAARGFLAGPLTDHVAEWSAGIGDDLLDAIERMQATVRGAFTAAA